MKKTSLFFIIIFIIFSCHIISLTGKQMSHYPFIAGNIFKEFCDFRISNTSECSIFNPKDVQDGDTIYVEQQGVFLYSFFKKIHPFIKAKYILITHNSRRGLCYYITQYAKYLKDKNIIMWFGKNLFINHKKTEIIPVGIENNLKKIPTLEERINNPLKKDKLCYLNFDIGPTSHRRHKIRKKVLKAFEKKKFCYRAERKSFKEYLKDLSRSKFVLSPKGNGTDCFRTWESLLVGSIPIVSTSKLDPIFKDLPVLIIKKWEDITEEFLLEKYEEMLSKKYNLEKIYINFWFDKIRKIQKKIRKISKDDNNKTIKNEIKSTKKRKRRKRARKKKKSSSSKK